MFFTRYVIDVLQCVGFNEEYYCDKYIPLSNTSDTNYIENVLIPSGFHIIDGVFRVFASSTYTLFYINALLAFQTSTDLLQFLEKHCYDDGPAKSISILVLALADTKSLLEKINQLGSISMLSCVIFGICIYSSVQTSLLSDTGRVTTDQYEPK